MKKLKYSAQLLTNEWKERRLAILKKDGFRCVKCSSKTHLQVHHKYYENGKMAWEYPDKCLITLCSKCHKNIHEVKPIKIKNPPSLTTAQKVSNRINKMKKSLPKKDRLLQERYDKL